MSSIYRKGRDGYFYYQTYVRNPKTGKKDKRIFHSLKTKNRQEATEKQIEFDKEYYKTNKIQGSKTKEWIISNSKILILLSVTSIVTLYLDELLKPKHNKRKNSERMNSYEIKNKIKDGTSHTKLSEEIIVHNQTEPPDTIVYNKTPLANLKEKVREPIIPTYNLERLETLSGNFEQVKIYLTVDKNTESQSLLLLCEKIIKDYSEFSNFVICLYSSDWAGIELANGNVKAIGIEEYKRSWLAMYTYNDVEGEYFDDNPSGYLGNN